MAGTKKPQCPIRKVLTNMTGRNPERITCQTKAVNDSPIFNPSEK
jgi:hypothetical protein